MSGLPAEVLQQIEIYEQGPRRLRAAVAGFPADKLCVPLPPGDWSVQQVVCHLSDFEIVCADRMHAVIAEDGPQLPCRDENRFVAALQYDRRNLADELDLIEAIRKQMVPLLRSLTAADYQRVGIHSLDGPLTLATLLTRIARHIPHHAGFIEGKKEGVVKG